MIFSTASFKILLLTSVACSVAQTHGDRASLDVTGVQGDSDESSSRCDGELHFGVDDGELNMRLKVGDIGVS
jgi:hypothetical protein